MWYVIQVINGREDVMRERIERMVPAGTIQELFYPQFQTEIKVHGEWVNTTKPLFPGYLICDTADPRTVQQYLLRMDDFARVLSQDGQFVPLAKEEVQLIGSFTHKGDRVVPMSEALKDGDQVVVTAGPLLGHEGLIKSINRRKSTAYLELDPERFSVVVVGLSEKQAKQSKADAPSIVALPKTNSMEELAEIYTACDVLLNPSAEETFGMNVAEAAACGTGAIVVEGSACAEVADPEKTVTVPENLKGLDATVVKLAEGVSEPDALH